MNEKKRTLFQPRLRVETWGTTGWYFKVVNVGTPPILHTRLVNCSGAGSKEGLTKDDGRDSERSRHPVMVQCIGVSDSARVTLPIHSIRMSPSVVWASSMLDVSLKSALCK